MQALLEMMEGLVEAAAIFDTPTHELGDMAQFLVAAASRADRPTLDRLARRLATVVDINSPHAPVTFVLAGALVENGADPDTVADELLDPLPEAFAESAAFIDELESEHGTITEEIWAEAYANAPHAWHVLELIWRPCIAVMGRSVEVRNSARPLLTNAERIAYLHAGGEWIASMLRVLDGETMFVVHPGAGRTFECVVSGIASNFELQTQLMAKLIGDVNEGWLPGERPSDAAIACVEGNGPQVCDDSVTPAWRISVDESPESGTALPGNGDPSIVEIVDGRRTVYLHSIEEPRPYAVRRLFATLHGNLTVVRGFDSK